MPAGVLLGRPPGRHLAGAHAVEADRVEQRLGDVAPDQQAEADVAPVVDERDPGAEAVREGAVPLQGHPGGEHHRQGAGDEDRVELLPGVELGGEFVGPVTQGAGHRVPELDLGLRQGWPGAQRDGCGDQAACCGDFHGPASSGDDVGAPVLSCFPRTP